MRDYLILAIVLGAVPVCLFSPYFGVLMWSWIAYFNPHRFTWGIAYNFPVATAIAVPTLIGTLFARSRNRNFFVRETVLLLLMWFWFAFTLLYATNVTVFSDHIADGQLQLERVSKIILMTIFSIVLVNSPKKLKYLMVVTAMSFGLLAIKGAIFGYVTGGEFRVWGPPDSFVADNNDLALAINISLPMMFFLAREEKKRWLRLTLWTAFASSVVSVLLTYSRGGLLGLSVVLTLLAVKSRRKLAAGVGLVVCAFLVLTFAPGKWMERMGAFFQGHLDESAQLRLNAWEFAWNLAQEYPLTGGGFETFTPELYQRYTPHLRFAGPHSVYFQLLGEQGFVGLGLFLLLLGSCWVTLRGIRRSAPHLPEAQWMVPYTHMVETSLCAFLVSGAFLARAYFDLYFQLIAATIILKILYRREVAVARQASEVEPAATAEGPAVQQGFGIQLPESLEERL